jgi:hypothetical protein
LIMCVSKEQVLQHKADLGAQCGENQNHSHEP